MRSGAPIDGGGADARRSSSRRRRTPALCPGSASARRSRPASRVIDIFTPLCFGQRLGIFAGSGVGKSTLLAMLAGADAFDTVVVALVGERGREVREFLEDTIGRKNMAKTVAVVSTSDESAMMRKRAPDTAMRIAEHFRDRGDRVLLVLDSITRFAHALREVATASGEPPVARGYPASVFTDLPKLLERAGPGAAGKGSITAVFSVLVDGDDHNDPVADGARHARRPHRARPRHRRAGPLSAGQSAGLDLAARRQGMERRPARAGAQAEVDDRALRGHPRHPPARRLSGRRRRRTRHGGAAGAAHLRGVDRSRRRTPLPTIRSAIWRGT